MSSLATEWTRNQEKILYTHAIVCAHALTHHQIHMRIARAQHHEIGKIPLKYESIRIYTCFKSCVYDETLMQPDWLVVMHIYYCKQASEQASSQSVSQSVRPLDFTTPRTACLTSDIHIMNGDKFIHNIANVCVYIIITIEILNERISLFIWSLFTCTDCLPQLLWVDAHNL